MAVSARPSRAATSHLPELSCLYHETALDIKHTIVARLKDVARITKSGSWAGQGTLMHPRVHPEGTSIHADGTVDCGKNLCDLPPMLTLRDGTERHNLRKLKAPLLPKSMDEPC